MCAVERREGIGVLRTVKAHNERKERKKKRF